MQNTKSHWRWQDGVVDSRKEHIELYADDARKGQYEDWQPIARIGKPKQHIFPVHWLISSDSADQKSMIADARRDLDFLLIELDKPDPWSYAVYHCSTASNMYSSIHWGYFPKGQVGAHESSKVIHLSADKAQIVFGPSEKKKSRNEKTKK